MLTITEINKLEQELKKNGFALYNIFSGEPVSDIEKHTLILESMSLGTPQNLIFKDTASNRLYTYRTPSNLVVAPIFIGCQCEVSIVLNTTLIHSLSVYINKHFLTLCKTLKKEDFIFSFIQRADNDIPYWKSINNMMGVFDLQNSNAVRESMKPSTDDSMTDNPPILIEDILALDSPLIDGSDIDSTALDDYKYFVLYDDKTNHSSGKKIGYSEKELCWIHRTYFKQVGSSIRQFLCLCILHAGENPVYETYEVSPIRPFFFSMQHLETIRIIVDDIQLSPNGEYPILKISRFEIKNGNTIRMWLNDYNIQSPDQVLKFFSSEVEERILFPQK